MTAPRPALSAFVTGGSGFVGLHVARVLAERGHRVSCLSRHATGSPGFIQGELLDSPSYAAALHAVDVVVHLAAVTGKARPGDYTRTNVDGTRALLQAARAAGRPRIVFVSTIAVTFPDQRRYYYAQSKALAERVVAESGLDCCIVRPTMVAGAGSPVLAGLARLARLPVIPAFGGATARVQPILAGDLATLIADVVERPGSDGETLEMGGPEVLPLRELLDRMHRRVRGRPARMVHVPLAPVIPVLALFERIALRATPLTVGQLATFRFDAVAAPNALWKARAASLAGVDAMLDASLPG